MANKLKTLVFSGIAFIGFLATMAGTQPTSVGSLYQPELPEKYK